MDASPKPSPDPQFVHVVCNAPLIAPKPLPYHSPSSYNLIFPTMTRIYHTRLTSPGRTTETCRGRRRGRRQGQLRGACNNETAGIGPAFYSAPEAAIVRGAARRVSRSFREIHEMSAQATEKTSFKLMLIVSSSIPVRKLTPQTILFCRPIANLHSSFRSMLCIYRI
ncbi:hypothetical protein BC629DRAFT_974339 [Irpex lacteus]|nr:hypothetical protein BC629DRAFT_974339 [Irpex lacteus]